MSTARKPKGTASTTRLRKLECSSCGYIVRVSRSCMVRGLPTCCCGELLAPDALEDMQALYAASIVTLEALEAHPEHEDYVRQLNSIAHGQASHVQRGAQSAGRLAVPEALAMSRVLKDRAARADGNRLNALREHNPFAAAPVAAEMPF